MTDSLFTRADKSILSYRFLAGDTTKPALVYCHGWLSSKDSRKATIFQNWAQAAGLSFVSFDFPAHGLSSGTPASFRIGHCLKAARDIIGHCLDESQELVLVGSSLGGWIVLLLARLLTKRVRGIVTLAAAPDCTELIWKTMLNDEARAFVQNGGVLGPDEQTRGYCFTKGLFEEGRRHLLLNGPIDYAGDCVLIHGDADKVLPWQLAVKIKNTLSSAAVRVVLVKGCSHAFDRPEHMQLALKETEALYERVEKQ